MTTLFPLFTIVFCLSLLVYRAYKDIHKYQLRRVINIKPDFKNRVIKRVEIDVSHLVKPISLRDIDSKYQK